MKDERIRILFFLNAAVRGGVEEVVLALVRGLDRRRFEVHLAAPGELIESFRPDLNGAPVGVLETRLVSWKQAGQIRRLAGYIRSRRIDIVNPHRFYATLFAAPIARLAGAGAVVETTHGPEVWRRSWWKRSCVVDRWIERLVTLNIAVSEANRTYLIERKGYPAAKIRVVPNGRELARYRGVPGEELEQLRRRYNLAPEDRVLVVVGRLDKQKGHRYLIEALPAVAARFPRVKVLLAGDGALRGELEAQAQRAGVREQVILAGYSSAVAPLYQLAEFAVLPSLYEGMPLAAIEAAAAGRPIVASRVDGTSEVVEDGRTGLLVPPRDPAALSEALLRLLGDAAERQAMGESALRKAESSFGLERQIAETGRLYEEAAR